MKRLPSRPRVLVLLGSLAAVAVGAVVFAASSTGGPANATNAKVRIVPVELQGPASASQLRAAGIDEGALKKKKGKKLKIKSFVSNPIPVDQGTGKVVGLNCPAGFTAIAGGQVSNYVNLFSSNSGMNRPDTGAYTKGTWWTGMTNVNIDGVGGTLEFLGVVSCVK